MPTTNVAAARRFLDLLAPDEERFIFAAGDDDKQRARDATKAGKLPWVSAARRDAVTAAARGRNL